MRKAAQILRLYLKSRNRRNTLVSLVQALTKDENIIPYCSVFTNGPNFSFPTNFAVSEYPGLLFCHALRDAQGTRLIACWKSKNHLRLAEAKFRDDLGLTI